MLTAFEGTFNSVDCNSSSVIFISRMIIVGMKKQLEKD
jgi:hypothetical protein